MHVAVVDLVPPRSASPIRLLSPPVQPKRTIGGEAQGPSDEKIAVVSIDDCDTALSLRFGTQLGNYSCAAQGKQTSNKK